MRPTVQDVHIDQALTMLSVEYTNPSFVAEQIMPVVSVKKESDKYFIYGRQDLKQYQTILTPKGETREFEYTIDKANPYSLTERGLHTFVPQRIIDNADTPLDPQKDAVRKLTNAIMLDYEIEVANKLTDTSSYASGHYEALSEGSPWSDYTNSNPIKKVDDIKVVIQKDCGRLPNTMLVSRDVFNTLRNHPVLKDVIKYTQFGIPRNEDMARAFEVENFIVAEAVNDTEKEGLTRSTSWVWNNVAIVAYVEKSPSLYSMSLGYTFRKQNYRKVLTETFMDPEGIKVIVKDMFDPYIISNYAGYLLTSVIA
jgi:hypothetical protein